jgi:predicted transcriptional regulator
MEKIYTVNEISLLLNKSCKTIRKYITQKYLKASIIGNSYIITQKSLDDFIQKGTV